MKNGAVFIDRFSAGLGDLSRKEQASVMAVLRVLERAKRFSCFEASDNIVIATTVTDIIKRGLVETKDQGYPWTGVKLTDAARAVLSGGVVNSEGHRGADQA